ncbi:MAG: hypothetical protein ABSD46_13580 [Bacteroidota bacterium]
MFERFYNKLGLLTATCGLSALQLSCRPLGGAKYTLANRRLTEEEIKKLFTPLFSEVRKRLTALSRGKKDLRWALQRKLLKELIYDERGKPMYRRKLKEQKRLEQNNKCAVCGSKLPTKYSVLDRFKAMKGYTIKNTRLICQSCDTTIQQQRGYK